MFVLLLAAAESWFDRSHLEAALPRLTALTSLALDKCEMPGGGGGGGVRV